MKRCIRIAVAVIIFAFVSTAVISDDAAFTPFVPTVEIVLVSDAAVNVRLVASGEGTGITWYVMGQFEFPGYIGVHRLTVRSYPDSPVKCDGVMLATDLRRGSDSTALETFAFGIHAGALRRVIAAEGMARFIVIGQHARISIDLEPVGEDMILDALLKLGEK